MDADFLAVSRLLAELGRPDVTPEAESACRETFTQQLGDERCHHLVAVDAHDAAIGFCSVVLRNRLNQPSPEAWIPDLVVTASARGAGVGSALLDAAEAHARSAGCPRLALESGHERTDAHRLYRARGHDAAGLFFRKALT